MTVEIQDRIRTDVTTCLRGLAGGDFIAGRIQGNSVDDPDEVSPEGLLLTPDPIDAMDILNASIAMDPVELGILIGAVSARDLRRSDKEANELDVEASKHHMMPRG